MLKMVVLNEWNIDADGICGLLNDNTFVYDKILAVAKESDDVMLIEGTKYMYKLDPPWRMQ